MMIQAPTQPVLHGSLKMSSGYCSARAGEPVTPGTDKDGLYSGAYITNDYRIICLWEVLKPDSQTIWLQGPYPEVFAGVEPLEDLP